MPRAIKPNPLPLMPGGHRLFREARSRFGAGDAREAAARLNQRPHRDDLAPLARIARLRRLAWLIDAAGRVPGTRFRFGLNSLIGLAPAAGDALLVLVSLYFVYEAVRLGLPRRKINRMLGNIAIEALLGAVPLLGDFFDVVWKANLRNVKIIDRHFGVF